MAASIVRQLLVRHVCRWHLKLIHRPVNNCLKRFFCEVKSGSAGQFNALQSDDEVTSGRLLKKTSDSMKVEDLLKDSTVGTASLTNDVWTTKTLPSEMDVMRLQQSVEERPKTDPRDTCIILFPGQGSQFVGMGSNVIDIPNVNKMFDMAENILGYDLLKLCINGPKEELDKTVHCQPAIFVTSLAAVEKLRYEKPGVAETCAAAAGFSVGEITALVFAGSLTFEDGLRLIKIRAEAMQLATEVVPSGLITVFYHPDAKIKLACAAAKEWCIRCGIEEEYAVCSVSNYLFPHCKVIGGHMEALKFIKLNGKEFGIKKIKPVHVSGAFHTKLMKPAEEVFKEALKKIKIQRPLIPVHSNVDGRPYRDEQKIRTNLGLQMCSPVRWEQLLHFIYERPDGDKFPLTFQCGPGTALLSILSLVNWKARQQARRIGV